jgi:hypothetical protein
MRFQVLMAVSMKITVFWVAAPCSLVKVYRRLKGSYCLRHQGPDNGSSKNLRNVGKLHPDGTAQQPRRQSRSDPIGYISIWVMLSSSENFC